MKSLARKSRGTSARCGQLLAGALLLLALALSAPAQAGALPANVVLIQVDDMARSLLRAKVRQNGRPVPAMPNLLRGVGSRGVELGRFYASDPICGPSRASLLSGRAAHNHGMRINAYPYGYSVWQHSQLYGSNLPVWLQRAGYRTAHIGKYMNGYGYAPEDEVPPGWERWVTPLRDAGASYYGSILNIDGRLVDTGSSWHSRDLPGCEPVFYTKPGACLHSTDLFTSFALKEISQARREGRPFYVQLDYDAPHDDGRLDPGPIPPARLRGLARRVIPNYDLHDVAPGPTAPTFIADQPPLTPEMKSEIRTRFANEVASLAGVDQGIGRILGLLKRTGLDKNTYVVFVSDNGMFHGEHRIAYGKYLPHEPSARQPLLVRGPDLPAGKVSASSGSTLDLAPTVLAMTGVTPPQVMDGRSLLGELRAPRRVSKVPVLLEGFSGRGPSVPEQFLDGSGQKRPNQAVVVNYNGFVAGDWKYIRYWYGQNELYDLKRDPGEMHNLATAARMAPVVEWADQVVDRLAMCSGSSCRVPVAPPARP
ncbi:MAG: sulfatase-like hydrolase/transferase [Solirubrobacterales bacterium]|nr:sulfatase-like hydrolase/transferase [Solirubrobacterales bacterium]